MLMAVISKGHSIWGSAMRNSRLRTFLYAVFLVVMCLSVLLLSTTHSRLKDVEGTNAKCQQQRDSLSAQLQVVYEHKNRLERSLQLEKTNHKHTKEVFDKQISDLKIEHEREKQTLETNYSNLLSDHESAQGKNIQLREQLAEFKNNFNSIENDKKRLEGAFASQLKSIQEQKEAELTKLQAHVNELLTEKENLIDARHEAELKEKQLSDQLEYCHKHLQQLEKHFSELPPGVHAEKPLKKNESHQDNTGDHDKHIFINSNQNEEDALTKIKLMQQESSLNQMGEQTAIGANADHKHIAPPESHQDEQHQKVLEKPNVHPPNEFSKPDKTSKDSPHDQKEIKSVEAKADGEHSLSSKNIQDNNHMNVLEPPVRDHKGNDYAKDAESNKIPFKDFHNRYDLGDGAAVGDFPQVQPPHNFDKEHREDNQDQMEKGLKNQQEKAPVQVVNDHNMGPFLHNAPHYIEPDKEVIARPPSIDVEDKQDIQKYNRQINRGAANGAWVASMKRGPQLMNKRMAQPQKHNQDDERDRDYVVGDDGDDDEDDDQMIVNQAKGFQDADFDDQENMEGVDKNAVDHDKEEGVMVAPK